MPCAGHVGVVQPCERIASGPRGWSAQLEPAMRLGHELFGHRFGPVRAGLQIG